jgi:hypothetical protein
MLKHWHVYIMMIVNSKCIKVELLSCGRLLWGDTPRSPFPRAFVCLNPSQVAATQFKEVYIPGGPIFLRMCLVS